jgi:hypothetical protein
MNGHVRCYEGRFGSGKTYSMVADLLMAKRSGRAVFSNIPSAAWWTTFVPSWQELIDCEDGILAVDEAGSWFNSRETRNMRPEELHFFVQLRHRGLELWYVAQKLNMVDINIRRITGEMRRCNRYGPFVRNQVFDADEIEVDPKAKPWSTKWRRLSPDMRQYYSTHDPLASRDGVAKGSAYATRRQRENAESFLSGAFVRAEDDFGFVSYRPATPDDLWGGSLVIKRTPTGVLVELDTQRYQVSRPGDKSSITLEQSIETLKVERAF